MKNNMFQEEIVPKNNIAKKSLPFFRFLGKFFLVIGVALALAFAALALRLSYGPIDLAFAKEHIETALSDLQEGHRVEINTLALAWPNKTDAILLDLNGVRIMQGGDAKLSVDHVSMGLSGLYLFKGKILPSIVIIDGPTIQLTRQEDGELGFFWQEQKHKEAVSEEKVVKKKSLNERKERREMRKQAVTFLDDITDPKNQHNDAFSALRRFEIKRAVVVGDSVDEGGKSQYLALVDLMLRKHAMGLQGDLLVTLPGSDGKTAEFTSDILYRQKEKDLTLTADVRDINPARFAPFFSGQDYLKGQELDLSGSVKAAFDKNLRLELATLNLTVPEGQLVLPDLYDDPLVLKDVVFNAAFNRVEGKLDISNFSAVVGDVPLQFKTAATMSEGKIRAPLELKIPELILDKVPAIFPKSHLESDAGKWLTKKLFDGRFHDIILTTDFDIVRDPETGTRDATMNNVHASFKADGVTVKYSDTLMPVSEVIGEGVYENDGLTITGESGKIGDVIGKNVVVKLTDLSVAGGGLADINMDASGPLRTALEYVSDEPIAVGDQLGFDIKDVKGNIDFNLQLNFPTLEDLPKDEVKVVVDGTVTDMVLPGIVKGLPLTGGPYKLDYKDGAITMTGKGKLAGRDVDVDWLQYLDSDGRDFSYRVKAKIIADAGLRETFGIGLEDYISGPLPIDLTYIDKGQVATIDVKGTLAPATLHLKPFDYRKEPGVVGDLSLKVHMKGDTLEEVDQLDLKTEGFSLTGGRILFREFPGRGTDVSRGSIPSAVLGKTKAKVDFEVMPSNILKIVAAGPVVDASPFIDTDRKKQKNESAVKKDQQPMMISVTADKMITYKEKSIRNSKLYLETDQQGDVNRIEMDARVGDGDMFLRFRPENDTGQRTFRLESSDAGYTLKAFGLYDKVRGGKLVIYGQPQGGDQRGNLYGKAQMENFRVKNMPALAKLLNAMSMTGVNDLMKNDGLGFAKLESDFEWRFREDGNLLVLKDGRTSGSSLGLTFEGVMNQGTNITDVSGTIIPLSEVNKVLGDIPLIGNILAAGDALIAATYTISGPSKDPKVVVNPLSVLAPSFLRKILFEESVESKVRKQK